METLDVITTLLLRFDSDGAAAEVGSAAHHHHLQALVEPHTSGQRENRRLPPLARGDEVWMKLQPAAISSCNRDPRKFRMLRRISNRNESPVHWPVGSPRWSVYSSFYPVPEPF